MNNAALLLLGCVKRRSPYLTDQLELISYIAAIFNSNTSPRLTCVRITLMVLLLLVVLL